MSHQDSQTIHLGDGAYARWDSDTREILIFPPDDTVTTKRHWVSLDPNAMRDLVALADQQWPNWR